MSENVGIIGPQDHGRRMCFKDYEFVQVKEGRRYELARGVIIVTDTCCDFTHLEALMAIRLQLDLYAIANKGRIWGMPCGEHCKILVPSLESERHPDISVYKTRPPSHEREVWRTWFPELIIEVVAAETRHRDYVEKNEEYLSVGIREYWIVDPEPKEILVLRRIKDRWSRRIVKPPGLYRPRLLPGFELDSTKVFEIKRFVKKQTRQKRSRP